MPSIIFTVTVAARRGHMYYSANLTNCKDGKQLLEKDNHIQNTICSTQIINVLESRHTYTPKTKLSCVRRFFF